MAGNMTQACLFLEYLKLQVIWNSCQPKAAMPACMQRLVRTKRSSRSVIRNLIRSARSTRSFASVTKCKWQGQRRRHPCVNSSSGDPGYSPADLTSLASKARTISRARAEHRSRARDKGASNMVTAECRRTGKTMA